MSRKNGKKKHTLLKILGVILAIFSAVQRPPYPAVPASSFRKISEITSALLCLAALSKCA